MSGIKARIAWSGLLVYVSLSVFLLSGCAKAKDAPRPATFGAKAIAERFCALGPRVSGTKGALAAAEWIADELRFLGIAPHIDAFEDNTPEGKKVFRNVTGRIPPAGRDSGKSVLLMSHYDTKGGISDSFVGANDSGSSTALLLALAAYYRENPPDKEIIFAFLDGEESVNSYGDNDGLHGSRRLASIMKTRGVSLDGAILLDMIGDENLFLTIPANRSPKLMKILRESAARLGMSSIVADASFEMTDDHAPFLMLGYPAIDIIDFEYGSKEGLNDYWHTVLDTPDKLSDESMDKAGRLVLEMVSRL